MAIVMIKCSHCHKPLWVSAEAYKLSLDVLCDNENCEKFFNIENDNPPLMTFRLTPANN